MWGAAAAHSLLCRFVAGLCPVPSGLPSALWAVRRNTNSVCELLPGWKAHSPSLPARRCPWSPWTCYHSHVSFDCRSCDQRVQTNTSLYLTTETFASRSPVKAFSSSGFRTLFRMMCLTMAPLHHRLRDMLVAEDRTLKEDADTRDFNHNGVAASMPSMLSTAGQQQQPWLYAKYDLAVFACTAGPGKVIW